MRRKLSLACLFLAWLCANGAVWNVVQVVAWARMYHDFSRVMPATSALAMTFDGSAPCRLCHISQTAQDAERQQLPGDAALGDSAEKMLLVYESVPSPLVLAPDRTWPGIFDARGLTRTQEVPVRPPRG